ncbi:MAG: choice-of-anchor C family protein [Gemmataceae bacterium]
MRFRATVFCTVLAIGVAVPAAHGQSVVNGSFELGSPSDGGQGFTQLSSGSTAITGWSVGGAGVDWIGIYWQPSAGNRSVDLSALSAGSISQSGISTVIGQPYRISFDMAGNPTPGFGSPIKNMSVQATGGSVQNYTFDTTGRTTTNMGWTTMVYDFVASSTNTTLTFSSLDLTPTGPAIDNVTIIPVPEPTSVLAVAAVAGLGVRAARRRRAAVA